jgi:hypothetical protein
MGILCVEVFLAADLSASASHHYSKDRNGSLSYDDFCARSESVLIARKLFMHVET